MRVSKPLIYANGASLAVNGILLWLMTVRMFPPILGLALIIVSLAVSVWFSCWAQGKLPKKEREASFYSAPTEKIAVL